MASKSIPLSSTEENIPSRVPLDEFAPSIFDAANYANGDTRQMLTIIDAVLVVSEFDNMAERHELVHKLILIKDLAGVGKYLGNDLTNIRESMIVDCMLASDDPLVRKAARL